MAAPSITLATSAHAYPGTGATVSVTAGDIIIVSCSWNNTAGNSGVSDTQGNGYTALANQSASSNFTRVMTWYAIAGSTGSVTCNVSGGFSDMGMSVDVFTGHRTTPTVTSTGHTGAANPDVVTLTTYPRGAVYTYYASESTPVSAPSGNNTSLIQYDSGHADARFHADDLAGGSYTFGYNPGTVQANQNSVGVAIGNAPFANSKTQSATAHITSVVNKTQPAIARVAINSTKTQPAIARISKNFTKTQTATANINVRFSKTQTATARIISIVAKTQTSVSRIAVNAIKIQTAVSRIQKTLTKTQSATANIGIRFSKTQPAVSRIATRNISTQTATAKISGSTNDVYGRVAISPPRIVANVLPTRPRVR